MPNPELDPMVENTQPETITLKLNINEFNIVCGGLQELPHRVVDGLLRNIMSQAQDQFKK